jgi:hypothetical protein
VLGQSNIQIWEKGDLHPEIFVLCSTARNPQPPRKLRETMSSAEKKHPKNVLVYGTLIIIKITNISWKSTSSA